MNTSNILQVQLNDISINYYDNLNYDKQTLFFIHGLGQNLNSWVNQIKYFHQDFRIIVLDLRGHGSTSRGDNKITIEQCCIDILTLLKYLKIKEAHFIGLSLGGLICQYLTVIEQSKILSLSLCNTFSFLPFQSSFPIDTRINMIRNMDINKLSDYYTRSCFYNYNTENYNFVNNMFKNNDKNVYLETAFSTFLFDSKDFLSEIDVPTLIIAGDKDMVTPIWCSQYLNQNIKNSQLVIIPNAGHLSMLEQPEIFNNVLNKFLQEFIISN